ncbi:MAG TPA: hypothetical protein DEQ64_03075 [Lachnoclostridium sp.]|uniref:hypothetical protein n=1 Tax=Lacrimispora sp. TaxID=2719234 RepID=UPI000EDBE811|nr:hypothetical protein [Lacrimispora sp.]HCD42719.1 hypothetical protein [Lachnoclostridium sp.]
MKQKARRWNVVMGTVVILALFVAGVWWLKSPSHGVFKIGNYTITQDHLALYESDCRAEVSSYFYNKYQLDPNEDGFWENKIQGEIPREVLEQKAMNRLAWDTVERIKASQYGIPVDITLKDIKRSLEEENKKRQSSLSVSYGPGQYGLMEYISRTQMEVRDELKGKLMEEKLKPSEEELKELYASADPSLFDKGCKARIGIYMYYGMKAGEYPEELKKVWDLVEKGLTEGMEPADIVTGIHEGSQVKIEYEEAEYDTAYFPRDNQEMTWLAEQTRFMEPGQSSGVLDYGASQGILKVLEKQDYGRAAYEESVTLLRNLWLEGAYQEYIKQCMEEYGYSLKR